MSGASLDLREGLEEMLREIAQTNEVEDLAALAVVGIALTDAAQARIKQIALQKVLGLVAELAEPLPPAEEEGKDEEPSAISDR